MSRPSLTMLALLLLFPLSCTPHGSSKAPLATSVVMIEDGTSIIGRVAWKESPSGLAIGVAHVQDLTFDVYFANQGTKEIPGIIRNPAGFILELNGKYYAMADHGGKSSYMPPGRTYGPLKIDMSAFWEIPKLVSNYTVAPNDSHPILKKGKNRLYLHYKLRRKLVQSARIIIEK